MRDAKLRKRVNANARIRRERWRKAGACVSCGKHYKAATKRHFIQCPRCRMLDRIRHRADKAKKLAAQQATNILEPQS